ncbi:uncharacterized protein BO97DRAFT_468007 [Aspergillus homomorphus CBS 101889]|uniref:Aminoglycoside phosphotransferase domain-containing protein n=1 Tax=Aspergillus homomorphus (strain CBS 101889) TaxID=1450537 RepID=A0A395I7F4_ASPHC|nr:hypothetical protein BO97DRAFT_468007 [Aspergillus homomorphus CBS 101889]RAL15836.1 hypothetical protein BO97DRAFT_468007 [Aspergillus homomorphus CBS 101889]
MYLVRILREIKFTDTSFFTTDGANRQLPTPTQVRALSKGINTCPRPAAVKFAELGLLVKFGRYVTTTEALNLWTIKKTFGDDIPVPEVFGWRVDQDGFTFIYMELIGGPTLEECWDSLDALQRRTINDQLCGIMGKLRTLAQDPSERFIGSINREHLLDYVFIDQPKTGPFLSLTHADLNRRNIMVPSTSPVRVVIVDWQQSGWYPDYWEYCKAA